MSDKPVFFLINAYTTGLAPAVLKYMLGLTMEKKYGGVTLSEEIGLRVKKTGLILPEGASGRWTTKE
jgi:23S rRNA (cytosine1962-C5)-methyltransferase